MWGDIMLLNLLTKEEKHYFLDLAKYLTKVDGNIEEAEFIELKFLTTEMGKEIDDYETNDHKIAIDKLESSSLKAKKIVLINLITLILSDDFYHTEEHYLLEQLLEKWKISERKKAELFKVVYGQRDLREKAKIVVSS